jgi:hypothetical protein
MSFKHRPEALSRYLRYCREEQLSFWKKQRDRVREEGDNYHPLTRRQKAEDLARRIVATTDPVLSRNLIQQLLDL